MEPLIKLPKPVIEREGQLEELELKYNLKFPEEYRHFFVNYELNDFFKLTDDLGTYVGYQSEQLKDYVYSHILISHFCTAREMEDWYEMFFDLEFFKGEGTQVVMSYGSTFIVLVANEKSPNYGKVLYYDLEMATDKCFVLGDSFNEFLSFIGYISTES